MGLDQTCPLCGRSYCEVNGPPDVDGYEVNCPNCGPFATTREMYAFLQDKKTEIDRMKVAAVAFERRILEPDNSAQFDIYTRYILAPGFKGDRLGARSFDQKPYPFRWEDLLARFPVDVAERLDRCLVLLGKLSPYPGRPERIDGYTGQVRRATFSEYVYGIRYVLDQLDADGLVKTTREKTDGEGTFVVTPKGWKRIGELDRMREMSQKKESAAPEKSEGPKEPTTAALKALFALSGNRCAYPQCDDVMVDSEGRVKGIACHIKGDKPGSPRYDEKQSNRERHGFHNLIGMCSVHHKNEIDGPEWKEKGYSVEWLLELKRKHETEMGGREIDPGGIHIGSADAVIIAQQASGGTYIGKQYNYGEPSTPKAEPESPSADALHVLFRAAHPPTESDDYMKGLIYTSEHEGTLAFFVASGTGFAFRDHEHQARMEDVFEELKRLKLIKPQEKFGYRVTQAGYAAVKSLQLKEADFWWVPLVGK